MNLLLTELLNLPGIVVEDWQQTERELILLVEKDADYAACSRCSEVSNHLHKNHDYRSFVTLAREKTYNPCYARLSGKRHDFSHNVRK